MTRKYGGRLTFVRHAWGGLRGVAVAAAVGMLLAAPVSSAPVSYFLNQSNKLTDGVNYLKVTLSDGENGGVDFKVEILDALQQLAGDHFGIQAFAFNVVGGTDTEARDVSGLPDHWSSRNQRRMDGFGLYDIRVAGTGHSRIGDKKEKDKGHGNDGGDDGDTGNGQSGSDVLEFSITGVDLDTLLSYADLSHGRAPQGHFFFSALVGGLDIEDCIRSAYFAGPGDPIVPVPGAVWLFGSGLMLLSVVRRRSSTK